jgi:hypothetical protein
LPLIGIALAILLWGLGVSALEARTPIAAAFSPLNTAHAFWDLITGRDIWLHVELSLKRVGIGLLIAIVVGVPLGILIAMSKTFARRQHATVSVAAHGVAVIVDAAGGHGARRRRCAGLFSAGVRGGVAGDAQYHRRRGATGSELVAAGAQSVGNALGNRAGA